MPAPSHHMTRELAAGQVGSGRSGSGRGFRYHEPKQDHTEETMQQGTTRRRVLIGGAR